MTLSSPCASPCAVSVFKAKVMEFAKHPKCCSFYVGNEETNSSKGLGRLGVCVTPEGVYKITMKLHL